MSRDTRMVRVQRTDQTTYRITDARGDYLADVTLAGGDDGATIDVCHATPDGVEVVLRRSWFFRAAVALAAEALPKLRVGDTWTTTMRWERAAIETELVG